MAFRAAAVRLIALDVDGTLLDPQGMLRPAVRDAVRLAASRGIAIALVTGRRYSATLPVAFELGVPAAILACQGALGVAPDGSLLWRDGIALTAARATVELARALGVPPFVYRCFRRRGRLEDLLVYEGPVTEETWRWYRPDDPRLRRVEDVLRPPVRPQRITVFAPPESVRRFREALLACLPGQVSLFSTDDPYEGWLVAEVLPPRTDKARALRRLAYRLGIRREEVLAVGDYHNDTEMIAWAGIGVAMANAPEAVRGAADWVTASNGDDGVAYAIHRFALAARAS